MSFDDYSDDDVYEGDWADVDRWKFTLAGELGTMILFNGERIAPSGNYVLAADYDKLVAEHNLVRAELIKHEIAHTMIQCSRCVRGVRARHAVRGMCLYCADEVLDRVTTERDGLIIAWPKNSQRTVVQNDDGTWSFIGSTQRYKTRDAAVLEAAGISCHEEPS